MKRRFHMALLVMTLFILCFPVRTEAARRNEWVTSAKGKIYYYDESGQKLTGQNKIDGKYYYFDSKGVQ